MDYLKSLGLLIASVFAAFNLIDSTWVFYLPSLSMWEMLVGSEFRAHLVVAQSSKNTSFGVSQSYLMTQFPCVSNCRTSSELSFFHMKSEVIDLI